MSVRSIAVSLLAAGAIATFALAGTVAADDKVLVCHIPPGNPANAHFIEVSADAVPAHIAHGDHTFQQADECPF